jgi:hypothetical protein
MSTNIRQFSAEVRREVDKLTGPQVVLFQKKIGMEGLQRLILKTPVREGRARGNWDATIGSPGTGFDMNRKDPSGSNAINKGAAVIQNVKPFSVLFITNNLPYIEALENGHSGQAPNGMLAVTVAELQTLKVE